MAKIMLVGFAKLLLVFAPAIAVVFALLYFLDAYLIDRGLKQFLFIPAVVALAACFFLLHLILGPTMAEIKKLHMENRAE